jgi:hypothetical protein
MYPPTESAKTKAESKATNRTSEKNLERKILVFKNGNLGKCYDTHVMVCMFFLILVVFRDIVL